MATNSDSIDLLFLGTGAADWPVSAISNGTPDRAVRGHSSAIVDGHVLIDCGATVPDAIHRLGVDVDGITDVLLTHTHADHFDVAALRALVSQRTVTSPVNFWAHPSALEKVPRLGGIRPCPAEVGSTFSVLSLTVTALAANHVVDSETPLHYLLRKPKTAVLYATDGAWFLKSTWVRLRKTHLDAVVWDATCGETRGDWRIFEHNSVDMIRLMRHALLKQGVLLPHAQIFLTHMARTLCAPHDDMAERLVPEGLVPAYDGMAVSVRPDPANGA